LNPQISQNEICWDAIYGRDSDFLAAAVRNQWLIGVFTGHFEQATGRSVVEAAKCAA